MNNGIMENPQYSITPIINEINEINEDNLNFKEFLKIITCPKSKKIYYMPCLGNDGKVYECQEIIKDEKLNNNNDFKMVMVLKSFISEFLDKFPELKIMQYKPSNDFLQSYIINPSPVNNAIKNGNYDLLKEYNSFSLKFFDENTLLKFLENAPENIVSHFIDNMINYNETCGSQDWHLINFIASIAKNRPNILKIALDAGMDINTVCNQDNWTAMHQIAYYAKESWIVIYALDKNPNLYGVNWDGNTVIEYIFLYSFFDVILYLLNKIDKNDESFKNGLNKLKDYLQSNKHIKPEEIVEINNFL